MKIYLFILTIQLFCLQAAIAQPGDRAFSILTFDENGYVGCDHNNYQFFACSVNYPNSLIRSDSLELVWQPDLKTIKILEPLRCIDVTNGAMVLPYSSYFQGSSCLMTSILMIIRNDQDTMFITTAGADPYAFVVSPNGYELGLPFVFQFQIGLFYLQKLAKDRSTRILFNSVHRNHLLAYYNIKPNFFSKPADVRISYLEMNKQTYFANDTISITLTGSVLNDGSCGGGSILWTLQKFKNGKWIIATDNCCTQMDCGIGSSMLKNTTIPLILLKGKIDKELMTYPPQREIQKGQYRLVVYDDIYQLYWTEEFIIG